MEHPSAESEDPASDAGTLWLKVPAIYCDTHTTAAIPETKMVRIVFGDRVGGDFEPYHRFAVVMSSSAIEKLITSLTRRVADLDFPNRDAGPGALAQQGA